jgi:hypothetical protein
MSDMIANHISARIAQEPNAFLINAYGMLYEEISASLPRLNGDSMRRFVTSQRFGLATACLIAVPESDGPTGC